MVRHAMWGGVAGMGLVMGSSVVQCHGDCVGWQWM